MATAGLPAVLARQLVAKLAGGAAPGTNQGGASPLGASAPAAMNMQAGGKPGSQAGDQVARQLSELQGADPGAMLQLLNQVKSIIVPLYVRSAFQMPGVARNIAQAQKYIDNAIKEAEQASATAQTVQPPIANNASIPNPQSPGMGGMGLQDFVSGGGTQ